MLLGKPPCDEGVVLTAPAASPCAAADRPWVLAATILGSSLAFIDGTVVTVALPALQRDFGAGVADIQWVVEAYGLFLSALLLLGGALGDRWGRRRIYAVGIALFAAASAACAAAPTIGALIVARAVQGVGAALLVPGSLAIISATFPERERGRAIGTWSGFSAITMAAGPVLGGWLIEHLSWRWAFVLNLPLAAVVLALLFRRVPESRAPGRGRLDWMGGALATIGLGGVVYGLIDSSASGWRSPRVAAALVAGVAGLAAFGVVERRSAAPMVPLDLFRSRRFVAANVVTLLLYGGLGSVLFYLPLVLVQAYGYSETRAGAAVLPFIVVVFALSRWSGGLLDRVGARLPLVAGPLTAAAGFASLARPDAGGGYRGTFFPAMVLVGVGMALSIAPLTTTVMNGVDVRRASIASAINNAVSRTAGLLAVAVLSLLVVRVYDRALDRRLAGLPLAPALRSAFQVERTGLGAARAPRGASAAERVAVERAVADALVAGFRAVCVVAAALASAAALTAALLLS